jgi:hypothetical protein
MQCFLLLLNKDPSVIPFVLPNTAYIESKATLLGLSIRQKGAVLLVSITRALYH